MFDNALTFLPSFNAVTFAGCDALRTTKTKTTSKTTKTLKV